MNRNIVFVRVCAESNRGSGQYLNTCRIAAATFLSFFLAHREDLSDPFPRAIFTDGAGVESYIYYHAVWRRRESNPTRCADILTKLNIIMRKRQLLEALGNRCRHNAATLPGNGGTNMKRFNHSNHGIFATAGGIEPPNIRCDARAVV